MISRARCYPSTLRYIAVVVSLELVLQVVEVFT